MSNAGQREDGYDPYKKLTKNYIRDVSPGHDVGTKKYLAAGYNEFTGRKI